MLCSLWIYCDVFTVMKITSHKSKVHAFQYCVSSVRIVLCLCLFLVTLLCPIKTEIKPKNLIRSYQPLFPAMGKITITLFVCGHAYSSINSAKIHYDKDAIIVNYVVCDLLFPSAVHLKY